MKRAETGGDKGKLANAGPTGTKRCHLKPDRRDYEFEYESAASVWKLLENICGKDLGHPILRRLLCKTGLQKKEAGHESQGDPDSEWWNGKTAGQRKRLPNSTGNLWIHRNQPVYLVADNQLMPDWTQDDRFQADLFEKRDWTVYEWVLIWNRSM